MDVDIEKDNIDTMNEVLKDTPQAPDENATASTHGKKHSKQKKRDSTFLYGNEVAEILKSSDTSEQKLSTVCNKYAEMLHANRKLMMAYKMAEGRIAKMQQENEQCQQQRSKAVLARSRLENLCRELQKLNKAQKEEIDLKLRLEEEKRKEISATFQSAFAEMSTLTNQNTEKNTKMREENLEMREKIKFVRERIELSEQQLEKVRQQAQLELQLAEAKMAKVKMEMTAEKETLLKEKQQLLLKLTEYQVRIQELQATEVGLRSQISMYTEKYDDFQNALTKSNEVFSGFNEEMEKMSKKILKLEKETSLWKQRWEKSHAALLDMAADKQTRDAEMSKLTHKLSLLQELCKAFQRERTELLAQLRAHAHANPSDDPTKINKMDIQQVEELSKDCQELKDNLVQLQGSLAEVIFETENEQKIQESQEESDKNLKTETVVINSLSAESNNDQEIKDKLSEIKVSDSEPEETKEKSNLTEHSHDDNQSTNAITEITSNSQTVIEMTTKDITITEDSQSRNKSDCENPSCLEKNVPLSETTVKLSPSHSTDEVQKNDSVVSPASDETQKTNNSEKKSKVGT
ncbi:gamma-taxilin [Diachasma alloeum]|uniref:gamma-taxilin n=1 Tax=Diachasma alloeum TaxID=454923 RepID=UPI000738103F|nr:gamma-taxilin [Diachasma alloeum]XP_015121246.1 gamma-taxilin [Diachasma alloeum]XP_015121247.1 gamma-taxilin [Diachasma alloeum]XP_015121248.1 gamma-taxilin [Diachasma alloeum]